MSVSVEVSGTVVRLSDIEQVSETFRKRELVVQVEGDYNNTVPITFAGKRVDTPEGLSEGQTVNVLCNLGGRYWEGGDKYFVDLSGWKVDAGESPSVEQAESPATETEEMPF